MLHGFTGSPSSFLQLKMPRRALTPALGGHCAEPASTDFWAEVDRLAALAPLATQLFGYSLGARLALGMLARYPNRFEQAVLVSVHPGLRTAQERAARQQQDGRFVTQLRERGLADFIATWEQQPLWDTQRLLSPRIQARKRQERSEHTAEGLARSLLSVGLGQMPDLRPALARSRCKVDFLVGALDTRFVAAAQELCQIVPGARVSVADDAGHDLLLERPVFCSTHLSQGLSR